MGNNIGTIYHPREEFAQTFAACFLMPASKVRAIIEKEFGGRKLTCEYVLYLKRYFGVSSAAMLRKVRGLGYISAAQHEAWLKLHPETRGKEVFGSSLFSDRYELLQLEVAKQKSHKLVR
jgi:Zn-dependent peptidase ImmA (M78 family)